ncbi:hypothetical protein TRFO_10206 [Tritrichomonas foetus]|uniref:Uncharacterized protein n=1 Tax=Tritrichomonas foetus TaxID=1144522 RepID=A0A1J4JFM3_9EUKA|nr:hypothetical protein TRFO_10206 [Tritrichomonas foetus]|eukprot:OHS96028.1 hypothetical protein TRFO_10206 [Tritrichomonas foetus]
MTSQSTVYEHFVYFTYKFEWKVAKEFDPKGLLKVFLPKSFPLSQRPLLIPVNKRVGYHETTIDACVDDFFVDCAIRNSFLHIVKYSKNNDKKTDKFTKESIFLDAGVLFIPDRREASITVDMQLFEYLTFSIQIDEELLALPHIKKFAPTIIYINKIDNLGINHVNTYNDDHNSVSNYNFGNKSSFTNNNSPIYFECQIGSESYFLCPRYDRNTNSISIDAAILIAPRTDKSIVFKVHDHDDEIPETFIGSGLFVPLNDSEEEESDEEESINEESKKIVRTISEENILKSQKNSDDLKNNNKNDNSKSKNNEKDEKEKKKRRHRHKHYDKTVLNTLKRIEAEEKKPVVQYTSPLKSQSLSKNNNKNNNSNLFISGTKPYNPRRITNSPEHENNINNNSMVDSPQIFSPSKMLQPTYVSPIKPIAIKETPTHGYCHFYLFPERHINSRLLSSSNDSSYQGTTVSIDIIDPASRFPNPGILQPVSRPLVSHKRPAPPKTNAHQSSINQLNRDKCFFEDPKILNIEKPTTRLLRWVVTCTRFAPASRKLLDFIENFHRTTIHGFSRIKVPSFKNCHSKSADLITGVHISTPKEEVFILETRAHRPNKASLSLELFLREEMPKDIHIIANNSESFPAPRLYCCMENLIHRIDVPIVVDELLQLKGLYFQQNENHKLFNVIQCLSSLLQNHLFRDIVNSFPNYNDVKMLEKRSPGLYAAPLQSNLNIAPIIHVKGSDFGDIINKENNNNNQKDVNITETVPLQNIYFHQQNNNYQGNVNHCINNNNSSFNNNSNIVMNNNNNNLNQVIQQTKERLTNYYLARPNQNSQNKQRNDSVSLKSKKRPSNENDGRKSKAIKPPDEDRNSARRKAPRNQNANIS